MGDHSCLSLNLSSGPHGSVAMSATDNENTHDSNNFLSFPSHLCTFGAFPALSSAAVTFQSWLGEKNSKLSKVMLHKRLTRN